MGSRERLFLRFCLSSIAPRQEIRFMGSFDSYWPSNVNFGTTMIERMVWDADTRGTTASFYGISVPWCGTRAPHSIQGLGIKLELYNSSRSCCGIRILFSDDCSRIIFFICVRVWFIVVVMGLLFNLGILYRWSSSLKLFHE